MDLISRQDAIDAIVKVFTKSHARGLIIRCIKEVPSAQPEIIRCRECKHKEREQPGMVYCPMMVGSWVADDHFCKWGEKEVQNENATI